MTTEEYREVVRRLREGGLKLLYVSPEKLGNAEFRKSLKGVALSLIAVDEAHCISEWGHNFRPDYLKLAGVCKSLKVKRILALTATATPKVEADIRKRFRIAKGDVVKRSFHRANLDLRITPCAAEERKGVLFHKVRETEGAGIVYVTRQETAEEVATFLAKNGISARAYHAGLRGELRREIQEEFMGGGGRIVVATIAFGMGVDKADIRRVFHYNVPKSLEGYSQEIGRAGRDGLPAECEMLGLRGGQDGAGEFHFLGHTFGGSGEEDLLERVLRAGEDFDVSFYDLATTADIRQTVVEIIFAYLETEGVLEGRGVFWDVSGEATSADGECPRGPREEGTQVAAKGVFESLDAEWKWLSVPIRATSERLGVKAEVLRELLSELEAADEVVLKKSGWRHAFRMKQEIEEPRGAGAGVCGAFPETGGNGSCEAG